MQVVTACTERLNPFHYLTCTATCNTFPLNAVSALYEDCMLCIDLVLFLNQAHRPVARVRLVS